MTGEQGNKVSFQIKKGKKKKRLVIVSLLILFLRVVSLVVGVSWDCCLAIQIHNRLVCVDHPGFIRLVILIIGI